MTLRTKLALFLLPLVVLPLLLVGQIANNFLYNSSRQNILGQMSATLWHASQTIQNRLTAIETQLDLLSENELLNTYINTKPSVRYRIMQSSLYKLFFKQRKVFLEKDELRLSLHEEQMDTLYNNVKKYDLRLLLSDGQIDTQYSNDEAWARTNVPQNLLGLLPQDQADNKVHTVLQAQVDSEEALVLFIKKMYNNKQQAFYLVLSLRASFIISEINKTLISKSGFLFVTNSKGEIIFKPRSKLGSSHLPKRFSEAQFAKYMQHVDAYSTFTAPFGKQTADFQVKQLLDNVFIFGVLPATNVAESSKLRVYLTIIIAISMLLTFSLLFVVLHFLVIRPVQQLARASQQVGAGNFDAQLNIHHKDEIGDLARTFSHMMYQLKTAYQQLEQAKQNLETKVRERTQDLEDLNRELRNQQQKAEEANKAKTHFMANMSHELRTPMNGILGMAELLSYTSLDAKQKMRLQVLRGSADALMNLINEILDITSLESGKLELEIFPFDIVASITMLADKFSQQAEDKGLRFELNGVDVLPQHVLMDKRRFEQVLENLLENAVKFTEQGYVRLNIEQQPKTDTEQLKLAFIVEDSGIGIPPEKSDHIFEKFTQIDDSSTRQFGGSGLGLAISYQLVKLMGGEMGVNSMPRQGARFWFVLALRVVLSQHETVK